MSTKNKKIKLTQEIIEAALKDFRSKGGKARAKKLSKERRKEIGLLAIKTRWAKKINNFLLTKYLLASIMLPITQGVTEISKISLLLCKNKEGG